MKPSTDARPLAGATDVADERADATKREVRSEDLFGGSRIVLIRHADAVYTLRRTSNGKLILTK